MRPSVLWSSAQSTSSGPQLDPPLLVTHSVFPVAEAAYLRVRLLDVLQALLDIVLELSDGRDAELLLELVGLLHLDAEHGAQGGDLLLQLTDHGTCACRQQNSQSATRTLTRT